MPVLARFVDQFAIIVLRPCAPMTFGIPAASIAPSHSSAAASCRSLRPVGEVQAQASDVITGAVQFSAQQRPGSGTEKGRVLARRDRATADPVSWHAGAMTGVL